ncbi:Uma2 family endonuclease [Kovacikia minuta CCNUW1]|uniref:Uma2 family endonuclease n=1 Tax=Kovacikia minuta TaxID=2931930 RepID=UPI001CCA9AB5|nr:Uma2 family endonuclease [Kovacikia minuta]UBF29044.1 Uma2 family endonuclease [Kovacikia minuta CCNUW1]
MNSPKIVDRTALLLKKPCQWQPATWEDYVALRDEETVERMRLFFSEGWLWFEMGNEGMNHSRTSDLFIMLILCWKQRYPDQKIRTFSRCQLEKVGKKACAPDLVIYLGDDFPYWEPGQRRFINLDQVRVPDLVGEVSDTTLATDLDEKKRIYADLQIPEYWVLDARGRQVLAFQLQENGTYQGCKTSNALQGLSHRVG